MLELRNVDTYYGNIQALRDISLNIEEGEIVTLIGANGAGKSTTLMTICGINRPRKGEILWYGKPIHQLPPHEIVTMGISQVPEGRLIFPDLSVSENLDLGAFLRRDPAGVKDDLDYVFSLFPILSERRKQAGPRPAFLVCPRGKVGPDQFDCWQAQVVEDEAQTLGVDSGCVPAHAASPARRTS